MMMHAMQSVEIEMDNEILITRDIEQQIYGSIESVRFEKN